tara:strand:+ start:1699 stop:3339 length:1641 start_codon:yes stop_codon:yes gene_type:complete
MLKNLKVLSLKYRPQIFEDLIGQEIVSKTIYNSIKQNKIPNAFLFTGIRGIGKTTIARIIAKALNCENGLENICKDNFCKNCNEIVSSSHIDVLEMDAASRTGVDDVRELIEFSRYGPSLAKYKIFIIDEVHMLSKQAFNALLKTLEEPPQYLKFIFATTEIKKIPVTVISRCQRFDLSRIKFEEMFNYIKKIVKIENREVSDEAIKLISKISEGSVRDALSLLDRALINQNKSIDLNTAKEIFGYYEKTSLIELFENLFSGNEKEVINIYRSIYSSGVEPKIFLNDFLEILYYFKNISYLKLDGNNFLMNNKEYNQIETISKNLDPSTIFLFWQFTINTLDEIDVVSNQSVSVEMFLMRLLYLKTINNQNKLEKDSNSGKSKLENYKLEIDDKNEITKNNPINQIKNIYQEEKKKPETKKNEKSDLKILNFEELIKICDDKKEIQLKYELENNVNLVSFNNQRIEISFNEKLDKEFVKNISSKLFEWTNMRWIISFSKEMGKASKKQVEKDKKTNELNEGKKSKIYKDVKNFFSDVDLIKIEDKE